MMMEILSWILWMSKWILIQYPSQRRISTNKLVDFSLPFFDPCYLARIWGFDFGWTAIYLMAMMMTLERLVDGSDYDEILIAFMMKNTLCFLHVKSYRISK